MHTFTSDLAYALRLARKTPAFTVTVILLLALGTGASTAMFSILDAWLLEPLHFPDPNRLMIILKAEVATPNQPKLFDGYRDWEEWMRANRTFSNIAAVMWRNFEAPAGAGHGSSDDTSSGDIYGMIATYNLFDTLGVRPERGRTFRAEDRNGPPVAVIGHELWQARFGGEKDIVGKTVKLALKSYQIIGVMPPGFGVRMMNQPFNTEFYALMQGDEEGYRAGEQGPLAAIGRLKPGVSLAAAQQELRAMQKQLDQRHPDNPKGFTPLVLTLQANNTGDLRASLQIGAVAVAILLLIVCANVGSLLLGQTMQRQREIAIRAALGSGRLRIVRQLMTESALVALVGAALGLLVSFGLIRAFAALDPFGRTPPNALGIDWRALIFIVAVASVSTFLFGLPPALHAAREDLNAIMKAAGRGLSTGIQVLRARLLLVAGQVTLSLVLLVAALLMFQTLERLATHPLGFRVADVTIADITWPRNYFRNMSEKERTYDRLLEKLSMLPGVQAASISNVAPLFHPFEGKFSIQGQPEPSEELAPKAGPQAVSPGWFRLLDIPLLEGRSFNDADDEKAPLVAMVDEMAVRRAFGGKNPIGQRIKFGNEKDWRTVVGVVGNTSYSFYNTVAWLTGSTIYYPEKQAVNDTVNPAKSGITAALRGSAITAAAIRQALKSVDPGLRLSEFKRMGDLVSDAIEQPRVRMDVLSVFAVTALVLAALGIYGLMNQSVIQRRHEIGIRMALGAQARDVVRMIVVQGLELAVAGAAVGVFCAFLVAKVLASLLYGVKPTDAAPFAIAVAVLLGSAVLAAFLPARAAAKVDPTRALRSE
jgi:putative ABC transport system permease protein